MTISEAYSWWGQETFVHMLLSELACVSRPLICLPEGPAEEFYQTWHSKPHPYFSLLLYLLYLPSGISFYYFLCLTLSLFQDFNQDLFCISRHIISENKYGSPGHLWYSSVCACRLDYSWRCLFHRLCLIQQSSHWKIDKVMPHD